MGVALSQIKKLSDVEISGTLDINVTGLTITSTPPTNVSGSTGDKMGQLAFDDNYLYYSVKDFAPATFTISGGGPTHILDRSLFSSWMGYYNAQNGQFYLQGGVFQDDVTPLAGWYIVDDNGTVRQIGSSPVWFTEGGLTPVLNGNNWFMVLDGPFTISDTNASIVVYETLPTVTHINGSGDMWKSLKLNDELNITRTYKALLTQTGSIAGRTIYDFQNGLVIGEKYTITDYIAFDDFSNIADCQNGGALAVSYTNTTGLIAGNYGEVGGSTNGDGINAWFWVIVGSGGTITSVSVGYPGYNYATGDTVTILGSNIGGSDGTNDITITITGILPITNVTGSIFIAKGETPASWSSHSELTSNGGIVANVLENTLGYDIFWTTGYFDGMYIGYNNNTGPFINSFPRNVTTIKTQNSYPFAWGGAGGLVPEVTPLIISIGDKDDAFSITVWDYYNDNGVNNNLYYTPVELTIKQAIDTTPIVIYSEYGGFPMSYVAVNIFCGPNVLKTIDTNDSTSVTNITELIDLLNLNPNTNVYGVWSEDLESPGSVILTMPTYLKNQICPDSTLSLGIFDNS